MLEAASLRICAIAMLGITACATTHPGVGAASSSRMSPLPPATSSPTLESVPTAAPPPPASRARQACPQSQSAASFEPRPPSSRNLALVTLKGTDSYAVRDVTDIDHPFTVGTLGGLKPISGPKAAYAMQFVGGTAVSYYGDDGRLVRKTFDGTPVVVTKPCNGVFAVAWTPDGATLAYVTDSADYADGQMHLVTRGRDSFFGAVPAVPITGCVPPCDEFVDIRASFSPDGRYLTFNSYWRVTLHIWSLDGRLLEAIDAEDPQYPHAGPTMSVWSGSGYFFRDGRGVEVWRNGVLSLTLPGVAWIRPKASPTTTQIVYEAKDKSDVPSVYVLDSVSGATRVVARLRSEPVFLNGRFIWYRGERLCAANDPYPCGAEGTIGTGKTYVYDLVSGAESESIISDVWDVWPHAA